MAIYSASFRPPIARSAGRSATAAAAYRAGCVVVDTRTGEVHDYTKKRGVMHAEVILPGGGQAPNRAEFWNSVEHHHKRKDAQVARELVVAIPCELPPYAQIQLAREMGVTLAQEYGIAVDVCVHEPSRDGDDRNTHAHILMTACRVTGDGTLGRKCELLDPIHCQRNGFETPADWVRPIWERLANAALAEAGSAARIDHRSNAARGLTEVPGSHHGPAVTEILRAGRTSDVADRIAAEAAAVIARQVLDANAAAALLEAQAAEALAELAIELEIERVQAAAEREAAERAAEARAREEAAERAAAAQEAAQRAAEAQAAEQAVQAAAEAAQAQARAAEQAAERLQAAQAAERALAEREAAQRAVEAAERARQVLWPAYDAALAGQRQAGASLLATARALPKAAAWQRAIEAYGAAFEALERAQAVLAKAGRALAAALARLEAVDPAVREAREAREKATRQAYEAQQSRIAKSSADAAAAHARGRQRGSVFTAHHQVQQDDQERGPDDVPM
jgi:hypothetical protein